MRKTVKFGRTVRLMIPVWHQHPYKVTAKSATTYNQPMAVLELIVGKEYQCEELQALIDRGAMLAKEDYMYACSCGFVPVIGNKFEPSELSTGLDPEEDLN